jgi:predicted MPP superfamily phosphohydrolase
MIVNRRSCNLRNNRSIYILLAVVLSVYGLINFWVGLRGWQFLVRFIPHVDGKVYWLVLSLLAASFWAGRLGEGFLPDRAGRWLTIVGSYWLAALFYLILALALVEIVLLAAGVAGINSFNPAVNDRAALALGVAVFMTVGATLAYGLWNALRPRVVHYRVNIPRPAGEMGELHVVAVSDLHLGLIVHNRRLLRLVDMIGQLQPDLILLPGDIIEENPGPFLEQNMAASFRRLSPRYGIYAVPGNHEYIGGKWDEIAFHLGQAGINVLRDSHVRVADSFYLVGRDDLSRGRFTGEGRKDLGQVMQGVDRSLPVILMDHQPVDLERCRERGVDLLLAGHTHLGQMFPNNLITRRVYEVDWGYLRKGSLQVIVSCGFGTWGPPIRVGNRPEIVDIKIGFTPAAGA